MTGILPPKPITLEFLGKQVELLQHSVRGLERSFVHLAGEQARHAAETRIAVEILRQEMDAGFRSVLDGIGRILGERPAPAPPDDPGPAF